MSSKAKKEDTTTALDGASAEITKSDGLARTVKVAVEGGAFLEAIHAYIQEQAKTYKAPGFRPGKVPMPQLRQRFLGAAYHEVPGRLVQKYVNLYLLQSGLQPLGRPVYDVGAIPTPDKPEATFDFSVSFVLRPECPEVSYDKLAVEEADIQVADADIKEILAEWVKNQTAVEPIKEKRGAAVGDELVVDVQVVPPKGEPNNMTDVTLNMSIESMGQELLAHFVGKKVGDLVETKTQMPAKMDDKKLSGKKLPTRYTLKAIQKRVPLENEKQLPAALGLESLDDVKDKAKEILERRGKELAFLWTKRQVLDFLADSIALDTPQELRDKEFKGLWAQAMKEAGIKDVSANSGAADAAEAQDGTEDTANDATDEQKPANKTAAKKSGASGDDKERAKAFKDTFDRTEADLKAFFEKVAERRVRLGFVLSQLGKQLKITVTEAELRQLMMDEMARHPGYEKQIVQFYKNNPSAVESLQAPYFENKVIHTLMEKKGFAKTSKVSLKDLEARLEDEESVTAAKTPSKK